MILPDINTSPNTLHCESKRVVQKLYQQVYIMVTLEKVLWAKSSITTINSQALNNLKCNYPIKKNYSVCTVNDYYNSLIKPCMS